MKGRWTAKHWLITAVFVILTAIGITKSYSQDAESEIPEAPIKGMVTMLDLGADKCIPCKMMAPILKKLKKEYEGKASIVFIDVWKHTSQALKYRTRAIPTQIFFDENGKEVYRHVGFMPEQGIIDQLEKMGVRKASDKPDRNGAGSS